MTKNEKELAVNLPRHHKLRNQMQGTRHEPYYRTSKKEIFHWT
jgi:hypothetical protein